MRLENRHSDADDPSGGMCARAGPARWPQAGATAPLAAGPNAPLGCCQPAAPPRSSLGAPRAPPPPQ
eukprot:829038-Prorocentrum_minimum.AAC.1